MDEADQNPSDPKARLRARREAHKTWKGFLESTPPNVAATIPDLFFQRTYIGGSNRWKLALPALELHCENDGGVRWFDPHREALDAVEDQECRFLIYTCRNCSSFEKTSAVKFVGRSQNKDFDDVEVYKLGEFLPFAAPVSKRIQKLLDKEDLELYRQGMRSEAQGLGIGAATYFRRIVDSKWKTLVLEIRAASEKLGTKDLSLFDAALQETQFSNAVKMLKDAIPGKLLILDGENPLTLLYQPLSVQLHGLSDSECLQQAADIRFVLTALLENIADVLKDQNVLREAANRLKQIRS